MKHLLPSVGLLLAAPLLAAPATAQDDLSQSAAFHNAQLAALYERSTGDGWHVLEGGVRFRRTGGDGTGPAPTLRDIVSVHYTGSFASGQVFDSSEGRPPASFPLRGLIPAWQIAIPYMGVGDTAEIAVPMELGYGPQGAGPIPGGATLLFTIELLAINPAAMR